MLDLKWIRKYPDDLDRHLSRRGQSPCAKSLLDLDRQHREVLTRLQQVQAEKNQLDAQIGQRRARNQSWEDLQEKTASLKIQEEQQVQGERHLHKELSYQLSLLPNLLDESVPEGNSEKDNVEVHKWGIPRDMPWAKDHITLGHREMDFEQAAKVSGSRFVYLKGNLAKLERALGQWMLDVQTKEFGFLELNVPYLVNEEAVFDAGLLPKFHDSLFITTDQRFLIPTAEVSLVNWVKGKTFSIKELPLRLTALTPCFRSEAGSAGKDVHGMLRQHQFHKVEMVVICSADEASEQHEQITDYAETLLQRLELPYRRVLLCSQDTGATSQKTYDIEVWMPSQGRYREIASCSHCGTYQARRLGTKVKDCRGETSFVHTLNGSGLPTGRSLIALLENHQQEDGSIRIPSVLIPYMDGQTLLKKNS